MNIPNDARVRLIGEALDGDPGARSLLESEGAAEELGLLKDGEERLRALFDPAQIAGRAADTKPSKHTGTGFKNIAAGIAIALLVGGAWFTLNPGAPPVNGDRVHRNFVINDQPDVVCDTPAKFLAYTREQLGEPIGADFDSETQLVGWRTINSTYDLANPGDPRALLARDASGTEIVVIFQNRSASKPSVESGSPLNAFERVFGSVVAWELTPTPAPTVLPLLRLRP